jgi:acetyl esterase/lipase
MITLFGFLFLTLAGPQVAPRTSIPVDTTFTTTSAWNSIRGKYPAATPACATIDSLIVVDRDIVYASPSGRDLHMDIFRPRTDTDARFPAVLIIHGGGWRSGNRLQEEPIASALAHAGYVAATLEYRLSHEAHYPATLYDLKAGVRWIRARAAAFSVDPGRIAVLGPSAGGTLALLLGLTGNEPRFEGDEGTPGVSTRVQAMISIDGVPDLTTPAESGKDTVPGNPSAGGRWLGATYRERPDLWREASPVNHAGRDSPPVLFINSAQARFHAGRDTLLARLAQWNVRGTVHTIPNTPHPFWLFHPWFDQTTRWVLEFLDSTFKPGHSGARRTD